MPHQRTVFNGLQTDPAPDRLGDGAFRVKNMVPVSPTNIEPRRGTSQVAQYLAANQGVTLVADAAPDGTILLIHVNTTVSGTTSTHRIMDIREYAPEREASSYSSVTGISGDTVFFGVVET